MAATTMPIHENDQAVSPRLTRRKRRHLYVVLPAFNEAPCLRRLIDRIDQAMFETGQLYTIVVVDDGSKDDTAQIALDAGKEMPVVLLQHAVNQGLGATIRDGLAHAANIAGDDDIIITMDADDTHTPGLIMRMSRMIGEGHDVVIASRYQPGSRVFGVPWFRRFTSFGAAVLFRVVMPIAGVRDYTCGFRAYRGCIIKAAFEKYGDLFIDQEGFQCMVDVLLKLRNEKVIFGEVPFILRYDQKEGASKMRVGNTIVKTLLLLIRRRING